jgi:short subunit dehydrogenase-like uncharacterized protein
MSDQHQRPVSERPYDLVIYGASGFVGRQAVRYLAEHAPHRLRWAVADLSRERLEALKVQIGGSATSADLLVADSRNQLSVDAVVSCARVILSTAGPFALYSDPVVDACVRLQTHYVDITGETLWVKDLIVRYHDRAATHAIRIVPGCGYDSVPSDLGTFLLVRQMHRELGVPCREVRAYFQMYGGFNGATISGPMPVLDDPFVLNPPGAHPDEEVERSRDPHAVRYDEVVGTWVGPHFMGPINTRVVRRSCALYEQWQVPEADWS